MTSFEEVMKLTRTRGDERLLDDEEARALYDCCVQVPAEGLVVEVGCDFGRSSSVIAQVGKDAGYQSLHIDPFTEHPEARVSWCQMMAEIGSRYYVVFIRSEQMAHVALIDLAYIDGDHSEKGVTTDLRMVANKVKPGGWLLAHDLDMPSVEDALTPYVESGWEAVGVFGNLGVWRRK